jgi:DNA-directed RNA polymerase sigma subunit (sigma70/sigma32)
VRQQRLTASQKRDLVIAAEYGDSDACRRLVEAFLPAIAGVARSFRSSTIEQRELLSQIGVGLGVTAERARQIEVDALNKVRAALAQPAPVGAEPTRSRASGASYLCCRLLAAHASRRSGKPVEMQPMRLCGHAWPAG